MIERSTAQHLAVRSAEVARLLEGGDNCGALAEGARLRDELNAAVDRGVIPEVYRRPLGDAVTEIQQHIPPCVEEVQAPPPPPAQRGKKERKKDKGRKDHQGGDEDEGDE